MTQTHGLTSLQTQPSPVLSRERGMAVWGDGSGLFTEHLLQHALELCLFGWGQRGYCQSSTLSSSKISSANNWSCPSICACFAAAVQPWRTAEPALVLFVTISDLTNASIFSIATSLSRSGFISRKSSARNSIAVIILTYMISAANIL